MGCSPVADRRYRFRSADTTLLLSTLLLVHAISNPPMDLFTWVDLGYWVAMQNNSTGCHEQKSTAGIISDQMAGNEFVKRYIRQFSLYGDD